MIRIKISTSSIGTDAYTFSVNPTEIDFIDNSDVNIVNTLHGSPSVHESTWDGRIRRFSWIGGFGATANATPNIEPQLSSIRAYEGKRIYINFGDLSAQANNRWPVANTWKPARFVSLDTKLRPGGLLRYSEIHMNVIPEV